MFPRSSTFCLSKSFKIKIYDTSNATKNKLRKFRSTLNKVEDIRSAVMATNSKNLTRNVIAVQSKLKLKIFDDVIASFVSI